MERDWRGERGRGLDPRPFSSPRGDCPARGGPRIKEVHHHGLCPFLPDGATRHARYGSGKGRGGCCVQKPLVAPGKCAVALRRGATSSKGATYAPHTRSLAE